MYGIRQLLCSRVNVGTFIEQTTLQTKGKNTIHDDDARGTQVFGPKPFSNFSEINKKYSHIPRIY